jgi:hypothetical protein
LPVKAIVNGRFVHVLHRVDHRSFSVSAAVREIVSILSADRMSLVKDDEQNEDHSSSNVDEHFTAGVLLVER